MSEREGTPEDVARMFDAQPQADPGPSGDAPKADPKPEPSKAEPPGLRAETPPAEQSDPVEEHNALLRQLLRGPNPVEEPNA